MRVSTIWSYTLGWHLLFFVEAWAGGYVALRVYRRSLREHRAAGFVLPKLLDIQRGTLASPSSRWGWVAFLFGVLLVIIGFACFLNGCRELASSFEDPFAFDEAMHQIVVLGMLPFFMGGLVFVKSLQRR